MAGEEHVDKAIASLETYLTANLPTYLSAYESALSLTDGDLGRPIYLDAERRDDNREIVHIFAETSDEYEGELKLNAHNCIVAWHFSTDADLDAGSLKARRVCVAMKNAIDADPTLGGLVVSAIPAGVSYTFATDTSNATRHAAGLDVRVTTYDG